MRTTKSRKADGWGRLCSTRLSRLRAAVSRQPSEPLTACRPEVSRPGEADSAYEAYQPARRSPVAYQRQRLPHTMTTTAGSRPQFQSLPEEAARDLDGLGRWLQKATFLPFETYEVCADNVGLVDASHEFRKHVEPLIKVSPMMSLWPSSANAFVPCSRDPPRPKSESLLCASSRVPRYR